MKSMPCCVRICARTCFRSVVSSWCLILIDLYPFFVCFLHTLPFGVLCDVLRTSDLHFYTGVILKLFGTF